MKSKYFTTSDGQEFYTETNAINHARTLVDRTVTPPNETVNDFHVEGAQVETGEGSGEGSVDDSSKVNFGRLNKAQLIAFATENELSIDETAINAVIVESIETQLTEKKQA